MKCDACGEKPAVIFVQQVSRENTVELHLCEACAAKRGLSTTGNKIDISLGGLFTNILDGDSTETVSKKSCPVCLSTLNLIRRQKKAGCAECYRFFRTEILSVLRAEGIEMHYTGALPHRPDNFRSVAVDREMLKRELQRAIDTEDYELAAYYRDRLRSQQGGSQ